MKDDTNNTKNDGIAKQGSFRHKYSAVLMPISTNVGADNPTKDPVVYHRAGAVRGSNSTVSQNGCCDERHVQDRVIAIGNGNNAPTGGENDSDRKNYDQLLDNIRVSSSAWVMSTPPPSDRETDRDETPEATIVVENQETGIKDQKPLSVPADSAKETEHAEGFESETTSISGHKFGVQEVKVDAEAAPQEDPAEPGQDPDQELQKEEHYLICISALKEIVQWQRIEQDTTKNDAEKKVAALCKELDTIKGKVVELRNELNIANSRVCELSADKDYTYFTLFAQNSRTWVSSSEAPI
jgi:hypothetical protein